MIIYEVNVDVQPEIADEFRAWLSRHVKEMTDLPGFIRAVIYKREDDNETNARKYTTHYYLDSRASLDNYLGEHAARMRADGTNRFGDRFSATRRFLSPEPS